MPKFKKRPVVVEAECMPKFFEVKTLEGTMQGNPGDWLITGVKGERYPCAHDIFMMTYEPADQDAKIYLDCRLNEHQ